MSKRPEIQSLSSCFNEDGEMVMSYEAYRYEASLDQQDMDEWEPDYDE